VASKNDLASFFFKLLCLVVVLSHFKEQFGQLSSINVQAPEFFKQLSDFGDGTKD
jgi:hypothetical protein